MRPAGWEPRQLPRASVRTCALGERQLRRRQRLNHVLHAPLLDAGECLPDAAHQQRRGQALRRDERQHVARGRVAQQPAPLQQAVVELGAGGEGLHRHLCLFNHAALHRPRRAAPLGARHGSQQGRLEARHASRAAAAAAASRGGLLAGCSCHGHCWPAPMQGHRLLLLRGGGGRKAAAGAPGWLRRLLLVACLLHSLRRSNSAGGRHEGARCV